MGSKLNTTGTAEHGRQSSLNASPEGFSLSALLGRIPRRRLMYDAQGGQAVHGFDAGAALLQATRTSEQKTPTQIRVGAE
jgi:hypothetical protein